MQFGMGGWLLSWAIFFSVLFTSACAGEGDLLFNRDIRPLLSANCFTCHGPDEKHRKAELRLDTPEGIAEAFAEGKLEKSEAWSRINETDPDMKMPPPDSHKELKAEEIALIKKWIEQGARFHGHWAFIPPVKPEVPAVVKQDWVTNPIDAFILRRLETAGMSPSEQADKERLLRRITFDLTGLPPTLAEIDAFLADTSRQAYEKVVDRLLASESYGERMTLAWIDLARYGDTSVFHADGPRTMWPWRDWVINAYNANKPFDEFTREQLAGDLLPNATVDQKIATAFNRNNASSDEGGAIPEELRVEYAVDRVKTTSMVWMGLTMECAQCHEHKYDPITQEDYYRFYYYFNQAADPGMQTRSGNQAPVVDVPNQQRLAELATVKMEIEALEKQLAVREQSVQGDFEKWLADLDAKGNLRELRVPTDALVHCTFDEAEGEAVLDSAAEDRKGSIKGKVERIEGKSGNGLKLDGSNFVDLGDVANFERDQGFSYGAWVRPTGGMNGAVIARMNDRNNHRGYDMYLVRGTVAMHIINTWPGNAIKVTTKTALKKDLWQHVFVTYDGSSKAAGIKIYFDGKPQEWAIDQDALSGSTLSDVPLYLGRRNLGSPFAGEVDDVRVFSRHLSELEVQSLHGDDPLLSKPAAERTQEDLASLRQVYLSNHDELGGKLQKEISALQAKANESSKPIGNVMIMQDLPQPRMTYLLTRGHYGSPDKEKPVTAGVPAALGPLPENAPPNRLGLAQWLTKPNHPLTSRVAVNRYWYMFFGTGLVKSLEDFGSQGDWPSHPELLDWLAVDFVENGWNVKRTIKQIVMSSAYRQSSRVTRELYEKDPQNLLLARGPRFRLQGEFVRDNALAASGLLVPTVGGPGVKPYQPPGLWNEVSINSGLHFTQDKGENLYRRSMYIYWKRSAPMPSMTIFDTPSREKCTIRRSRTNTPLQALVTLNDPQFVEASRAMAQRMLEQENLSLEDRITQAYRLSAGVQPNLEVVKLLAEAYAEELAVFQADAARAQSLLKIGDSPRNEKLDAAEHAALTVVMNMILNLDATLTRG